MVWNKSHTVIKRMLIQFYVKIAIEFVVFLSCWWNLCVLCHRVVELSHWVRIHSPCACLVCLTTCMYFKVWLWASTRSACLRPCTNTVIVLVKKYSTSMYSKCTSARIFKNTTHPKTPILHLFPTYVTKSIFCFLPFPTKYSHLGFDIFPENATWSIPQQGVAFIFHERLCKL